MTLIEATAKRLEKAAETGSQSEQMTEELFASMLDKKLSDMEIRMKALIDKKLGSTDGTTKSDKGATEDVETQKGETE